MPDKESKLSLEENIAALNKNIFLREFSFSKNKFKPNPNEEVELADHIIWIDKLLIAYQLKEREVVGAGSAESERNWFERKVLGKGTKQIRDTLKFLNEHSNISIENEREHVFNVNGASVDHIVKVVVYMPRTNLSDECRNTKYHMSSTAGLIHILPLEDYVGVCRNLITPAEIAEYFDYREEVLSKWSPEVRRLPEQRVLSLPTNTSAPHAAGENQPSHKEQIKLMAFIWPTNLCLLGYSLSKKIIQSADLCYPFVAGLCRVYTLSSESSKLLP